MLDERLESKIKVAAAVYGWLSERKGHADGTAAAWRVVRKAATSGRPLRLPDGTEVVVTLRRR